MTESDAQADAALDQDERVETLLMELSAHFINLAPEHLDLEIREAQRRICDYLGFHRSSLFEQPPDNPAAFLLTNLYQRPEMPPVPAGKPDVGPLFPWVLEQLHQRRTITISKLDDLPAEAARDKESFQRFGTRSLVVVPLPIGSGMLGALTFASAQERGDWPARLLRRLQLVAEVFANAVARARTDAALRESEARLRLTADLAEDRLRFEALIADLSSKFVNLTADEVDREIRDAERRICELLRLDLVVLWQLSGEAPHVFEATHYYSVMQGPQPPGQWKQEDFPWVTREIVAGRMICLSSLEELPAEAARDLEAARQSGIKSNLTIPLSVGGGSSIGALALNTTQQERAWPEALVKRLQLIAQVFANALARKRSDLRLRQSEEINRATFEQAAVGIAHVGTDGRWLRVNDKLCSIVGYPREELLQLTFQDITHPDDLQIDLDYVRQVLSGEIKTYSMEKRYFRKDRSLVWIDLAVSLVRTAAGEPKHFISVVADITDRKQAEEQLRRTLEEVRCLRDQLQEQNVYLQEEVKLLHGHSRIVGQSQALKRVLAQVEQVAPTGSTVLLLGETGTGKELIASTIHELSPRFGHPMVRVNCSAIPTSLIESELFGREKGAYTGALSKQIGRFELANGSTLFLDEIGDLPAEVQVKLLRVLEEKQIERLGSPRSVPVDVRIVAATNRDLEGAVREGRFRQDLYYRLNVFPITVPPLRERREDIPALVSALVSEFGAALGKTIESVAKESMEALQRYSWPGNVRELRNVIERAMIVAKGPKLWIEPPGKAGAALTPRLTLEEVEREHIQRVLEATGWRVRGRNGAAEKLGVKPTTLESRMLKLGIRRRAEARTK